MMLVVTPAVLGATNDKVKLDGSIAPWHPLDCSACHGSATPTAAPDDNSGCAKCHGNYEALVEKDPQHPDPNGSHNGGNLVCFSCHKQHSPSANSCVDCHPDQLTLPESLDGK